MGRHLPRCRVIRGHGRMIRIRRVGEPRARVRIDMSLFNPPLRELVFLSQHVRYLFIRLFAEEMPCTATQGDPAAKKQQEPQDGVAAARGSRRIRQTVRSAHGTPTPLPSTLTKTVYPVSTKK